MKEIFEILIAIEKKCKLIFESKLKELLPEKDIEKMYYTYKEQKTLLVSLRIIVYSYEEGDMLAVSPHHDKSAITLLFLSTDPPLTKSLF